MMTLAASLGTSQASANARASEALVAQIVYHGVRVAILSPGSRNTPLALALADHPQVEIKVVLDERSAAFFALGVARASGHPVVLTCTSGSALANYYPAVVEAYHSEVPLILLTADRPAELQGRGAPQTMNQNGFYGQFVKASLTVDAPVPTEPINPDTQTQLSATLQAATKTPKGPVHVNCGFRKPLWDPQVQRQLVNHPAGQAKTVDDDARTTELADAFLDLVGRFDRGVFICGPDAFGSGQDASDMYRLAEMLAWPVLAEASSGARFGHDHRSLVTNYDAAFRTPNAIPKADCIVRFGRACTSQWLAKWIKASEHAVWIVIHDGQTCIDPERKYDQYLDISPTLLLNETATRCLSQMQANLTWLDQWLELETTCKDVIEQTETDLFWEGSIAAACVRNQPNGSVIHVANSMPIRDLDAFGGRSPSDLTVFVNRGLNGIDGTIATALGEKFGQPGAPLLLIIGDLAFRHDANSLALCHDVKITMVVNDNGGGQIFRFLPISQHQAAFEDLFLTPSPIDINALCDGYGLRCTVVETNDALKTALVSEQAKDDSGIILARIDADLNYSQHQSVWQRIQIELTGSKA
ncbi:MAG: 2-succinyl-5-enolpyruvyl-6-hydroxy-3-cyclohexene-1-carboxylic-acid synthase [Myxococcales bacterium]|nr:2-succinyl-5-enolpyruvyl-6-hydroxy-3-cyclohexene-1-carboxylic-acid synthase [Myxococcales bacterium]